MTKHIITVHAAQTSTHLWCERDETGKIVRMTAPSGMELEFSYYGEWVIFQGEIWNFSKDDKYGEVIEDRESNPP